MASFAPLHTGQFIIKPRSLRRQRGLWIGMLVLLVLLPYATFEVGRMQGGYSVIDSQRARYAQARQIDALQNELDKLRRQLGSASVGRKVDQQSSDVMQQSLAELQATIQKQQEELAFYKAIVSPAADVASEPSVQRIEIQADAANRYLLRIVLIQPMQSAANAQGTTQVQIVGTRAGQAASLPLQEVLVDKSNSSMKFAYRYFQTIEQLVELPADFQPRAVQVELHAAQHAVQRQEFPWQLRTLP